MPKETLTFAMAPKAMKGVKAMKAFPQKKAMKSSVSSPCQKDKKSRQKVKKGVLKKNNLDKLGKLTLAEKVAKAAEGAETAEEAAQELKGMLTKQEHSRVWSKYNCHLKGQPKKEQKEFEKANKGAKGMLAALHMVKSSVPKFPHCSEFLESSSSLQQKEKWVSETKMVELFGQEEFYLHLDSGRISWRQDPWTPGVFNYKDNGDITRKTGVKKGKEYRAGQEYTAGAEDEEAWGSYYGYDTQWHLHDWQSNGKGKSLTKGNSLTKGKGKNKSKQKGKGTSLLAITDGSPGDEENEEDEEENTEENEWKDILSKAKKARDQSTSHMADCQAALELADKSKRLTKTAKKESEDLLNAMGKKTKALKDLLAKKDQWGSLAKAKALLVDAANQMKRTKEEAKELNQLANKTNSKASKK